ncbi:Microfibrillar-associated protein 1 [Phytophthora cinnamomi]|uniref:Microfibrillar-associated protein 1 n=1 Tax=Phytophthora cinnamomi TaxID=4785 RepID=UPI0035594707|nr:Microfibrillar-associated protein 1 [Phytophthora cinnamomi]
MDDGMTASELRQRYERGGSVRDCDLSAAQLRSRYAIPGNTFKEKQSDSSSMMMVVAAVVLLVILAGGAYAFSAQ